MIWEAASFQQLDYSFNKNKLYIAVGYSYRRNFVVMIKMLVTLLQRSFYLL